MLRHLRVSNFAIIHELDLELHDGFSVITGETGSGKSILLNALALLHGERADFSVIGPHGEKSIVEAEYSMDMDKDPAFFDEHDLDISSTVWIRREINTSGKSRAFINDTPVQLTVLKAFSQQHIRIHSQFNTLELKDNSFQLDMLDSLAGLMPKRATYELAFQTWQKQHSEFESLKKHIEQLTKEEDYLKFQLAEMENLQLDSTDYALLESDLQMARNRGSMLQLLESTLYELDGDERLSARLQSLIGHMSKQSETYTFAREIEGRLKSVLIEVRDIASEVQQEFSQVQEKVVDASELEKSLDSFFHVLRKHGCSNQEELRKIRDTFRSSVSDKENLLDRCSELGKQVASGKLELSNRANELHHQRVESAIRISRQIRLILHDLKLPDTDITFDLLQSDQLNERGSTECRMLFSANKGFQPIPIDKAASGGELSRVMLALQKLFGQEHGLPTLFFDEIDTGVSGDVAHKIGRLLKDLGSTSQILAITHLPQVAACASFQFKVVKSNESLHTEVKVIELTKDERVEEIARLMSGEEISSAARETARALMM